MDKLVIAADQIPSFRTFQALKMGADKNLLLRTWGGIGDQICAEPTLRFALETFKDCEISLATENPELYQHLKFKKVFDTKKVKPIWENYLVLNTGPSTESLTYEFFSANITHCVDFPTLAAIRCTLPIRYKSVRLEPKISEEKKEELSQFLEKRYVAIHAGKHWESKTFPVDWWNSVLSSLIASGFVPVLFGKEIEAHQGTVETMTECCVDLRGKLSLEESIWLLQRMKSMVTNDSGPMHMAATGDAYIAFIASAKHHDFIYHWRKDIWAWRMQHFNRGGMWDIHDFCPNKSETIVLDKVDNEILKTWLPEPKEIVEWIKAQLF